MAGAIHAAIADEETDRLGRRAACGCSTVRSSLASRSHVGQRITPAMSSTRRRVSPIRQRLDETHAPHSVVYGGEVVLRERDRFPVDVRADSLDGARVDVREGLEVALRMSPRNGA